MNGFNRYVEIRIEWNFIKDKVLKFSGDEYYGVLLICDTEGRIIKVYGYELVKEE